jgi:hypothetical protein
MSLTFAARARRETLAGVIDAAVQQTLGHEAAA